MNGMSMAIAAMSNEPIASAHRRLPLELELEIVGHLVDPDFDPEVDDMVELRTCALVHSSWCSPVQALLFKVIWLYDGICGPLFVKLLDGSPHIGSYVRELVVIDGREPTDDGDYFANKTLLSIAPVLVNLHTLDIMYAGLHLSPSTRATLAVCLGRSLRTLRLKHFGTETTKDFLDFMTGFPLLENLELESVGGLGANDTGPITLAMPPSFRIKRLVARWVDSCEKLLRWFSDMDTYPQLSIRSFEVEVTPDNGIAVGQFLRRLGPVLEEYKTSMFSIPTDADVTAIVDDISISSNTSLRSLTLYDLMIRRGGEESTRSVSWVPILLEQVSSTVLTDVELQVWYRNISDLDALKLPLLEKILTSSRYPALRRVIFALYRSKNTDNGVAEIETKMPALAEKGMLVFR
ncbi:hypothetical protein PLICRDRAFT_34024 [Plicaturopsis crispa FD-325 SS-3]|nr:hypothetical protein PLICRDRAFT_34024 [Plicaturopsis crispa FD-325 SS-3]